MSVTALDPWDEVVGQDATVSMLRSSAAGDPVHAWLFVGPRGSGKRAAARAFAADLLAGEARDAGDAEAVARVQALAHAEQHPDLMVVEREGAAISAGQASEIIERASRTPSEGRRKVLVLDEFHLVAPEAAAKLLKTIEEPAAGTFFVVLADELTPELVTIASRCLRVDFAGLTVETVTDRLVVEGIDPERAAEAANFSGGDLGRARVLATDERLALRLAAWRDLPRRLDGRGAAASSAVADIRAMVDDAQVPLAARHEAEAAEMSERIARYGQRGSGSKAFEARQRRETRRFRTDELRLGLAALAGTYRDELRVATDPSDAVRAIDAIQEAAEAITYNPNEELLLVALALRLPSLN